MLATLERQTVKRSKKDGSGGGTGASNYPTVKIAPDLHRKLKQIVSETPGMDMTSYVDAKIRSHIERDYLNYLKRTAAEFARRQDDKDG